MRSADFVEKRKFKRLGLSLPTRIRYDSDSGKQEVQEGVTLNVSFNGAYISEIKLKNIKDKDTINISLSVPREETRDFPFSRPSKVGFPGTPAGRKSSLHPRLIIDRVRHMKWYWTGKSRIDRETGWRKKSTLNSL